METEQAQVAEESDAARFHEMAIWSDGFSREADVCAENGATIGGIVGGLLLAAMNVMKVNGGLSAVDRRTKFFALAEALFDDHDRLTKPKH